MTYTWEEKGQQEGGWVGIERMDRARVSSQGGRRDQPD